MNGGSNKMRLEELKKGFWGYRKEPVFQYLTQIEDACARKLREREEQMEALRRQMLESVARLDEHRGILHIRRHLSATPLFKGIPNFRETRIAMLQADTVESLTAILDRIEYEILPNQSA